MRNGSLTKAEPLKKQRFDELTGQTVGLGRHASRGAVARGLEDLVQAGRGGVVLAARDAVTRDEPRVPVRIRDQRTVEARLVRRRHVDSHRKHACVPDRLGVQLVHEVSESKRYIGIAHAAGAV